MLRRVTATSSSQRIRLTSQRPSQNTNQEDEQTSPQENGSRRQREIAGSKPRNDFKGKTEDEERERPNLMLLPSDWKASGLDPSFMNFISTTGRVNPPGALLPPPFPPLQAYPPKAYLLRQPPRASRSLKPTVLLPPLVLPPILPPIHPTPRSLSLSLSPQYRSW